MSLIHQVLLAVAERWSALLESTEGFSRFEKIAPLTALPGGVLHPSAGICQPECCAAHHQMP